MTPDDKSTEVGPRGFGPDEFSVFMPPRPKRPGLAARHILFAGVAGACVLGVGLGLWARPAMSERQAAAVRPADAPKPQPTAAARQLEIVVDDRPAPIGAPIDVLPASSAPRPRIAPPAPLAEPQAPVRPAQGLLRVQDVTAPPPPQPVARPKLAPLVVAALVAPKPLAAKTKPVPPAPVHVAAVHPAPTHLAKAAPPPKPVAKPSRKIELARAAAAKAAAHKLELAQAAKAAKAARAEQIQLAKAEARGRAEARAEAKAEALAFARENARKRARLASLAHAFQRLLPHQAKPAPVEVARLDRKHAHRTRREPQVERASLKTHRAPHQALPPMRTHAMQAAPSHASGLMKVSAPRCANRDPGQALVCADPSLGAADRQLTRAYQDARNAGVPDVQLQRQQQRWLAARSAAAREAPWAVHDVYLARIAELTGQAREAHGDGY
jgi:uncharacterized protein YecT (DUF1311 family)